jgi:hypothetical protein
MEGEFCEVELPIHGVLGSSALSWCSEVLCALAHIHSPHTGVSCVRYVVSGHHVKAQDSYLPSSYRRIRNLPATKPVKGNWVCS